MIHRRYQPIVFAFIMAFIMSCFMSFIISINNIGFVHNLLGIWLEAWGFSFVIAFPVAVLVSPVVGGLVRFIIKQPI